MAENLNKYDYKLLNVIRDKKAYGKLKALSINELIELSNLSEARVRIGKDRLLAMGYIEEGLKDGKAKTFYMTQLGKQELIKACGIELKDLEG